MKKKKENKKKTKTIKYMILLITIIILLIIIISAIIINKNNTNKIKDATLSWYNDQNKLYSKTTIGALYENGYLDTNKSLIFKNNIECQVINIENEKVTITKENDCKLNEEMKKVPTIYVELTNIDDNSIYDNNKWTSSDVKVNLKYKNNSVKSEDIKLIYLSVNYQQIENNDLIISTDSYINTTYTANLMLNDGSVYSKDFNVMIDKTVPVLIETEITNDYYDAIFEDKESTIKSILYYVSENNTPPTSIEQFKEKENINIIPNKKYHIWAIGINTANLHSEFTYIGEFTRNITDTTEEE